MNSNLADVQQSKDTRGISINRVGIDDIDFPIYVRNKSGGKTLSYAKVNLYTSLYHKTKGSNFSRFIEMLMKWRYKSFSQQSVKKFLQELKNKLKSKDAYVEIQFPFFMTKLSPVSKKESVMSYQCKFIGKISKRVYRFLLEVIVPITSCCPCSKEISKPKGAHNQRGNIKVILECDKGTSVWIEDLILLLERQGSCEIYPLLKRVDEKYVTEKAYDNAKFVEDIARDAALALQSIPQIRWFKIKIRNYESIHAHNAVAVLERLKKGRVWRQCSKSLRQTP